MWQCEQLPHDETRADVERFLNQLNNQVSDFFSPDAPLTVGRAPGRLDLMGGIADYSGSLVLELPLAVATMVAVQPSHDTTITICSTSATDIAGDPIATFPLESLHENNTPISYHTAHTLFTTNPHVGWAAYVIGVLVVLQQEHQLTIERGLRILIHCEVPIGKGVSSSAALEVATMQALCAQYQLDLSGREVAILCQKVENLIVGAPCGIMDQMTSACGEQNSLLALLCQPAELQGAVPLPDDLEIWGIDSGVRHAVVGADYGSVRVGAFIGYRIISDYMQFAIINQEKNIVEIEDPHWHGYLANISPSLWEMYYQKQVPISISGAAFLAHYAGSTDTVTRIDPERTYAVRQPTAHPIYENHRVRLFRALLQQPFLDETQLILLGELMYQSHASYSACGLGSDGTDRLVELVRQVSASVGLYGAKITGGGSGGTVAVLAKRGRGEQIQLLTQQYEQETGRQATILSGSSSGAKAWGSTQFTFI